MFTEAHDYRDKEHAAQRYREQLIKYQKGDETMGVLAMYERAALDAGNSHTELSVIRMGAVNSK